MIYKLFIKQSKQIVRIYIFLIYFSELILPVINCIISAFIKFKYNYQNVESDESEGQQQSHERQIARLRNTQRTQIGVQDIRQQKHRRDRRSLAEGHHEGVRHGDQEAGREGHLRRAGQGNQGGTQLQRVFGSDDQPNGKHCHYFRGHATPRTRSSRCSSCSTRTTSTRSPSRI